MNLTVITTTPDGDLKKVYPLPVDRDLNEAVAEAKRLHPSWTRIKIMIHASKP